MPAFTPHLDWTIHLYWYTKLEAQLKMLKHIALYVRDAFSEQLNWLGMDD